MDSTVDTVSQTEQEILDAMPVMALLTDADATIIYVNPHFLKVTGYSLEQALGQNFFELLVIPSDHAESKKIFGEIVRQDLPDRKTGPIVTADGRVIVAEWCGNPTASGNVILLGYELSTARANPSRVKEILDGLPANIVLLDRDARIIEINSTPLKAAGLVHDEVIGRPFIDQPWFHGEEQKAHFRNAFQKALNGEIATADFNARFRDEDRILAGAFAPILRNGKVEAVVGFGSDITERRLAEESARKAETLLRNVVSGAPIVMFVVNSGGIITDCQGEAWEYLSGSGNLSGFYFHEAFSRVPEWKDAVAIALSGQRITVEAGIGGRIFELTVLPSQNGDGDEFGVTGVGFDITHRKASEHRVQQLNHELESKVLLRTKALQESEERFRQIAENVRDVFFLASPGLVKVRYLSPAFQDLWGESPDRYIKSGISLLDRVHPADKERVLEQMNKAGTEVGIFHSEFRIRRPDREDRWIRLRTFRLPFSEAREVAGVAEDITGSIRDRMKLIASRESADRANRAKSEFMARMSHELRTPLNAILGFVQVLSRKLPDAHQNDLKEVRDAGHHLLSLIDDLLDLSRVENDQLEFARDNLPVSLVLDQARRYLSNRALRRGQEMYVDLDPDVWVMGDRTRIIQILINLLSNASKYTPYGGKISLFATRLPDCVRIHVQDTGPGISKENLARMFIPFERLGESNRPGVGLGLYLSRELADRMGGTLGVNSEEGSGADFWLELPIGEPVPEREAKEISTATLNRNLDILYIEDNPVNLRVMESLLETVDGIKFRGVDNAEDGILEAQRHAPDIVLVDMHLGDSTGYYVLDRLRETSSLITVPLIAVSADAMETSVQNALSAGFSAYIRKPVQLEELLGCIHRLL